MAISVEKIVNLTQQEPVSSKKAILSPLEALRYLLAEEANAVDNLILQEIESSIPTIPSIIKHLILSGGKRLRPLLTLASAMLCGYQGNKHIQLATAVEFIHTATLLHDDVIDASALRRGSPTANNVWGNKPSILVGDFLLSKAFTLMVQANSLEVMRILSETAIIITEGEILQYDHEHDLSLTEATYIRIIGAKTAQLFAAACEVSAVLACRPEKEQQALYDFGYKLGLAFQITDDILDYTAKQESLGKTIGDDFRERKITLPVLYAWQHASPEEKSFWVKTFEEGIQEETDLSHAISLIMHHNAMPACMDKARQFIDQARQALEVFPDSPVKAHLRELLQFTLERGY